MFYFRVEWTIDKWGNIQFKMFIFERKTKIVNYVICIKHTPSPGWNLFFSTLSPVISMKVKMSSNSHSGSSTNSCMHDKQNKLTNLHIFNRTFAIDIKFNKTFAIDIKFNITFAIDIKFNITFGHRYQIQQNSWHRYQIQQNICHRYRIQQRVIPFDWVSLQRAEHFPGLRSSAQISLDRQSEIRLQSETNI